MPHGGFVLRSGKTGYKNENSHIIEYRLKLDSNPEFTGSVLVAFARACYRMAQEGKSGCCTAFDVPPAYLSQKTHEELRNALLSCIGEDMFNRSRIISRRVTVGPIRCRLRARLTSVTPSVFRCVTLIRTV